MRFWVILEGVINLLFGWAILNFWTLRLSHLTLHISALLLNVKTLKMKPIFDAHFFFSKMSLLLFSANYNLKCITTSLGKNSVTSDFIQHITGLHITSG